MTPAALVLDEIGTRQGQLAELGTELVADIQWYLPVGLPVGNLLNLGDDADVSHYCDILNLLPDAPYLVSTGVCNGQKDWLVKMSDILMKGIPFHLVRIAPQCFIKKPLILQEIKLRFFHQSMGGFVRKMRSFHSCLD